MAQLTDESVQQLRMLQDTLRTLKCNKQSKQYFDELNSYLDEMVPTLTTEIASMQQAAAFGQTLKAGQLKALQEFAAAVCAITTALGGPASTTYSTTGSSANNSSFNGSAVRPSASGRKPVLPSGVSTLNPDAYFHTKESLILALNQLHAAFKGSHPQVAKAVNTAKQNIEDVGLFEAM